MLAPSLYRNGVKLARYARWGQQIGVHRGMRASATALSIEVRIRGSDVLNDLPPLNIYIINSNYLKLWEVHYNILS